MRIKSIYLKKYKNIREQTLMFPNDSSYVALIGLNNSGKSNWLEAISLVFRDMYTGEKAGFTYKVIYDVDGKEYELSSRGFKINKKSSSKKTSIAPSNVIACYSGESLRLWRQAYEKYYMSFFTGVAKNEYSDPKLMYLNRYSWAICLIVLMCSDDAAVKDYLKNHLNIEDLTGVNVEFEFNEQTINKLKDSTVKEFLGRIHKSGQPHATHPMSFIDTIDIGVAENQERCRRLFYILFLVAMPKRNEQISLDKAIESIGININGRLLEDISEGEKKLLLIMCIVRILADKNSLLLLDEPDAHVHIANKVSMCNCFKDYKGQIVLTTHSPIFSDMLGHESVRYVESGTIKQVDRFKHISTLSDGFVTLVDGAFLIAAKKVVVTEGHTDIAVIKRAIELLSEDNPEYSKLKALSFISQGSADHTRDFLDDTILPIIGSLDKVVFIFDYDDNGKRGDSIIKEVSTNNTKIESLFYSASYNNKPTGLFYLEDYFPITCYDSDIAELTRKIGSAHQYNELKNLSFSLSDRVKERVKKDYKTFHKSRYNKFKVLLDKLIEVFNL